MINQVLHRTLGSTRVVSGNLHLFKSKSSGLKFPPYDHCTNVFLHRISVLSVHLDSTSLFLYEDYRRTLRNLYEHGLWSRSDFWRIKILWILKEKEIRSNSTPRQWIVIHMVISQVSFPHRTWMESWEYTIRRVKSK